MDEADVFNYYQEMKDKNFVLSFKGTISQDILVGMKEVMESQFLSGASQNKAVKKAYSVFIELSQNVLHHSAEKVRVESGADIGAGIVIIYEDDKCFEISSGNMIDNFQLAKIVKHCDHINSLDREELKRLYRERLKMPLARDRKSPRLGLVDISKKSCNPIKLEAKKLNDKYSFLVISTIIVRDVREDGNG